MVVLDQPTQGNPSPVRFPDERGETVTPPLPADWPRSPVPDSDEACPACGACAWDEVRPLDGSRGMSGAPGAEALPFPVPGRAPESADIRWEPTPFVVCRVCGHERSLGVSLTISTAGDGDPAEAERQFREFEHDRRQAEREALAGAAFPIYAPEDLEVTLNGWGGPPAGVNRVTVTHYDGSGAELSIETRSGEAIYETEKDLVLEALEELLLEPSGDWPRGSEAAATIWLEAREQEDRANRRRLMSAAQIRRCELVIDGSQEPFELATAGGRWAAALRRDDSVVIVTSTGVPPDDVRLVYLDDPVVALLGHEPG